MRKSPQFIALALAFTSCVLYSNEIPDVISKGGIRLDLTKAQPLILEKAATINEVADFAVYIMDEWLADNIEQGYISARELQLLAFCFMATGINAEKCCDCFAQNLGISGMAAEFKKYDVEKCVEDKKSLMQRLKELPYNPTKKMISLCEAYNPNVRNTFLFMNSNKVYDHLVDSRNYQYEHPQDQDGDMYVVAIDPGQYGKEYPQLKTWYDTASASCLMYGAAGLGGLAVAYGAGAIVCAFIPGPGWIILAGGSVASALGVAGFCIQRRAKMEYVKACRITNDDVKQYIGKIGERAAYIADVIQDPNGPYQKAYMGLVKAESLLERCNRLGWGDVELSAKVREENRKGMEELKAWTRGALTKLEDNAINYPMMVDLMEASSICLYMNYMDFKLGNSEQYKEVKNIRQYYLDNANKVSQVAMSYLDFSTGRIALDTVGQYNIFFSETYASNRTERIKARKEEEVKELMKKHPPLFAEEEKSLVEDGLIKIKRSREYSDLMGAYDEINKDPLLKELLGIYVGKNLVEKWVKQAYDNVCDRWLFPSWSKEYSAKIMPRNTDKIIDVVSRYCKSNDEQLVHKDELAKIKVVLEAMSIEADYSKPLLAMIELLDGVKSKEAFCRRFKSYVDRRSLQKEVTAEVNARGGAVKMAEHWCENLLNAIEKKGKDGKLCANFGEVRDLVEREVIPVWRKIFDSDKKWWRLLF